MNLTDELLKRLDLLAAKLGTTAQYLWGVYVKQAQVEVIQDLIGILICLLICGISAGILLKLRGRPWVSEYNDLTGLAVLRLVLISVGVVSLAMTINLIWGLPTLLLNPEYWALQQIVAALK